MGDFFKIRLKNGRWVPLLSYVGMLSVPFFYNVLYFSFPPYWGTLIVPFPLPLLALFYLLPFWGIWAYYKGHDTMFSLLSMLFLFFWVNAFFLSGVAGFSQPYSSFWMIYSLLLLLAPFLLAYFSMDERADWTIYIKLSSCFSGYFVILGPFLFFVCEIFPKWPT